jgi:uncharacterized damage-inducible protein DinB
MFPNIVERLRGTPARLEDRLHNLPQSVLTKRWQNTWSIQENAGHLSDLEPLWMERVRDLQAGKSELTTADLTNQVTWKRNHNDARLAAILGSFRTARGILVGELENAEQSLLERSAKHPRLGTPMRLIDLAFFVAEHDDHHLARITQLKRFGEVEKESSRL